MKKRGRPKQDHKPFVTDRELYVAIVPKGESKRWEQACSALIGELHEQVPTWEKITIIRKGNGATGYLKCVGEEDELQNSDAESAQNPTQSAIGQHENTDNAGVSKLGAPVPQSGALTS